MSYQQYGTIQASTYNAFTAIMNSIYADTNTGATSYTTASYGYGQTPALSTTVPVGSNITAAEWAALFGAMEKCGYHQGTPVVPPLPGVAPGYNTGSTTLPAAGNTIVAYDTPTGALTTLINTLIANRFNLYSAQTATINYGPFVSSSWTHTLTFTFTANFGSWDNARYFFNSGGSINISGSYPDGAGDAHEWFTMLSNMSPLAVSAIASTPSVGSPGPIGGFWNSGTGNPLTTSFQTLYTQTYSLSPYSGSYITVNAKLGAAAGTAGSEVVTFTVFLNQADSGTIVAPKGATTFNVSESHAAGTSGIVYPGPSVVITNLGFVST